MKKAVKLTTTVLSLAAGFVLVTCAVNQGRIYVSGSSKQMPHYADDPSKIVEHYDGDYEVNEYGQTYGSGMYAMYKEDYPDLVAAIGDHDISGYLYREDFFGYNPETLEEANKIQEAIDNGTYVPEVYNLYASDGKTVLDTFTETIS